MSLDPLNEMTSAGYTFNKDNPFVYTNPTGKYFNPGTTSGCDAQTCQSAPSTPPVLLRRVVAGARSVCLVGICRDRPSRQP